MAVLAIGSQRKQIYYEIYAFLYQIGSSSRGARGSAAVPQRSVRARPTAKAARSRWIGAPIRAWCRRGRISPSVNYLIEPATACGTDLASGVRCSFSLLS